MNNKPIYEIHSHYAPDGRPTDISSRVVSGSWARSLDAPYGGAGFTFKCRYEEKNRLVNNGDWVVIRDPFGVAYDLFYVEKVTYKLSNLATGASTMTGSVTCTPWLGMLGKVQVVIPNRNTGVGTVIPPLEWLGGLWATAAPFWDGKLGEALTSFFTTFAKVRLPASLGGELLSECIKVVYDEDTALRYAPGLLKTMDPVYALGGLPTNVPWNFNTVSVLEAMAKMFVASPMLIEMMPYTAYGDLGTEQERSKLVANLRCRPVLVYRYRPWRTESLADAITTLEDFKYTDRQVNEARVVDPVMRPLAEVFGISDLNKLRQYDPATETLRSQIVDFVSARFSKVTWTPETAKEIPWRSVRDFTETTSDDARVNVTSVSLSPTGGSSVESWESLGLPLINRPSVEFHGARYFKPEWPYIFRSADLSKTLNGGPAEESYFVGLRSVAAQAMQWHVNAHKLGQGTFSFDPLDALYSYRFMPSGDGPLGPERILHLWSGDIFKVQIRSNLSPYMAYAHTVEHSWHTDDRGAVSLQATVSFVRGAHIADVLTNKGKVPVEIEAAFQAVVGAATSTPLRGTPRQAGTAPMSVASIIADGKEYSYPGTVYRHLLNFGPNIPSSLLPNRVLGGTFRNPANNGGRPIQSSVIHYTDGSLAATAASTQRYFQGLLDQYPNKPAVATHFIIDPDGSLTQIMDLAYLAFHAEFANSYSVGIDLQVPWSVSRGRATSIKTGTNLLWNISAPPTPGGAPWKIIGASGNEGQDIVDFFSASTPQLQTLARLLKFLNSQFGFPLNHPRGTDAPNRIKRFSRVEAEAHLVNGSVMHHLQITHNRADSVGTELRDVVFAARSLP